MSLEEVIIHFKFSILFYLLYSYNYSAEGFPHSLLPQYLKSSYLHVICFNVCEFVKEKDCTLVVNMFRFLVYNLLFDVVVNKFEDINQTFLLRIYSTFLV